MSERPKQTFLAEIAREELQKKGQLFVFWTGIFWSPDSRDALIELSRFLCSGRRPLSALPSTSMLVWADDLFDPGDIRHSRRTLLSHSAFALGTALPAP